MHSITRDLNDGSSLASLNSSWCWTIHGHLMPVSIQRYMKPMLHTWTWSLDLEHWESTGGYRDVASNKNNESNWAPGPPHMMVILDSVRQDLECKFFLWWCVTLWSSGSATAFVFLVMTEMTHMNRILETVNTWWCKCSWLQ